MATTFRACNTQTTHDWAQKKKKEREKKRKKVCMWKTKCKENKEWGKQTDPFELARPLPPRGISTAERNLPRRWASWSLIAARFSTEPLNLRSTGKTKLALATEKSCKRNNPTRKNTNLSLRSIFWIKGSFKKKQQRRTTTHGNNND